MGGPAGISISQQERRAAAADLMQAVQQLAEQGESILSVLMGACAQPREYQHFPADDARGKGYRYFYHGHADMPRHWGEHGHFHLFAEPDPGRLTHLVGLSVDARGMPIRAFTTNRWVTDEQWAPAEQVLARLRQFDARASQASPLVSRWLQCAVTLFWPRLRRIIVARDTRLAAMAAGGSRPNLLEDRRMHVLTATRLSLADEVLELDAQAA